MSLRPGKPEKVFQRREENDREKAYMTIIYRREGILNGNFHAQRSLRRRDRDEMVDRIRAMAHMACLSPKSSHCLPHSPTCQPAFSMFLSGRLPAICHHFPTSRLTTAFSSPPPSPPPPPSVRPPHLPRPLPPCLSAPSPSSSHLLLLLHPHRFAPPLFKGPPPTVPLPPAFLLLSLSHSLVE